MLHCRNTVGVETPIEDGTAKPRETQDLLIGGARIRVAVPGLHAPEGVRVDVEEVEQRAILIAPHRKLHLANAKTRPVVRPSCMRDMVVVRPAHETDQDDFRILVWQGVPAVEECWVHPRRHALGAV